MAQAMETPQKMTGGKGIPIGMEEGVGEEVAYLVIFAQAE